MARYLTRKGWGRIYCADAADVNRVNQIIQSMDEFEYDYLPKGMVAPFSEYPKVIYTHKFDGLDVDALTAICWRAGILIWVFDSGYEEYPLDATAVVTPPNLCAVCALPASNDKHSGTEQLGGHEFVSFVSKEL